MGEVVKRTDEQGRLPNVEPAAALSWIVNRLHARLLHAASEVDQLGVEDLTTMTAFGPTDHQWIRAERELTNQLSKVCVDVMRVGLGERLVAVEEAKATMLVRAFTNAALRAGISRDQLKEVAPFFREELTAIQMENHEYINSAVRE